MAITIAMQPAEIALLRDVFSEAENYLEFGAGGSTCLAAEYPLACIDCVETDPEWIEAIQNHLRSGCVVRAKAIRFHFADIGPTREWGFPHDDSFKSRWDSYFLEVWKKIDAVPDLVLVDGRFRTACALCSFISCSRDTRVAVHDFYDQTDYRKNYSLLESVADIEKKAENLVIFRKRPDFSNMKAMALLSTVRHDPG